MKVLANKDNALRILSSIFFTWGLITVVSNSLIPHFKEIFLLDYKTAMLFPMAFFATRIIVSLPASFLMGVWGYKRTLKLALYWCLFGCLSMSIFVQTELLSLTLLGIFLMASGITAVQVVSSPYVSLLSTPELSTKRQSIAATFNSIGTILGPLILASVIIVLSYLGYVKTSDHISILFILISLLFLFQIVALHYVEMADIKRETHTRFSSGLFSLISIPKFRKLLAILLIYIGVEVCFGTFTIVYLADEMYGGLGLVRATQLISIYWGLMFTGRLLLVRYVNRVNTSVLFISMCSCSIVTCLLAFFIVDVKVGWLLLLVGLYNSALYPIVYAKALQVAENHNAQAAALLIMCSIGGAVIPFFQATQIDSIGLSNSYWVPSLGYLVMIWLFISSQKKA